MASRPAYPPDLARFVEEHWPAKHPLRVSTAVLDKVLAVAFHASLTLEEGRPTRFRLLLTDPAELPSDGAPNHGVLRLLFERPRSFTPTSSAGSLPRCRSRPP